MKARQAAVATLVQVIGQHRSLTGELAIQLPQISDSSQRALSQEICYGVLRWHDQLQALTTKLLEKPLRAKDLDIHVLVLCGLYQLLYMRIPDHAAVDETVAVARILKKPWASKLVNALLRRFQRERRQLLQGLSENARLAHPDWLVQALKTAWPDDWPAIIKANNARPPMTLRVNRSRVSRDDYLASLRAEQIPAGPHPYSVDAVILEQAVEVQRLPGFNRGHVSVQDAAAQQAAGLLALSAGQRLLDACAAPGGKTTHILECLQAGAITDGHAVNSVAAAAVTALDIDAHRLGRVSESLHRLGLQATILCADAADPDSWWDGQPYDRILLDAPCSATGVIRRHPDIKLLRRAQDIPALSAQQAKILAGMWPLLAPGGLLLYATCSILPEENHQVVSGFLSETSDASEELIKAKWGRRMPAGRQILPGQDGMDGFYYACLKKACQQK
ncbi:MAG: 16S rRNA (cytosine(967)-C(5))-methyltransferase RsmB [Gammaproteobacteria bacterium]|nr:MAG: 16S rRNA (cytosine(967)-C(5))-methyltransferase RsmB [Gammaproteobacteria bacterium]